MCVCEREAVERRKGVHTYIYIHTLTLTHLEREREREIVNM